MGRRLMFHQKIPFGAEGKGSDDGIGTEEAFVVGMIGDTIVAARVIIHEAEIEGISRV